ncbi:MAG: patatin-like phospholipase family protein, partial [Gemmatimonadota bacterium]|nr:patatin-like phospholipase family protein [Gemmatimonadota bacterium]
ARALPLTDLFSSARPRAPLAWGGRLPVVLWAMGEQGFALQTASVDEPRANAILNAAMLRGNLLARGNFDSLPIPFRAVATDLLAWQTVVLGEGDLAQAVRASIAIPIVFSPERIGGRVLVDGGLTANLPVGVARDLGARRVLVSDVTSRRSDADSISGEDPLEVADRLFGVLFEQPRPLLGPEDLLVRPEVREFGNLDFTPDRVAELIAIGRAAGAAALQTRSCIPVPAVLRPTQLPRRVTGLRTARVEETPLLQRLLNVQAAQDLDLPALTAQVLGLRDSDLYRSVWLHPTGNRDSVQLIPAARRLPHRLTGVGLSYDNELGGQVWLGGIERRGRAGDIELSALLTLARFHREAEVGARLFTGLTRFAVTPKAQLVFSNDVIRKFELPGVEDTRNEVPEIRLQVGLERPFANGWHLTVAAEPLTWKQRGIDRNWALGGRVVLVRRREPEVRRVFADLQWNTEYVRGEAEAALRASAGRLVVEPRLRAAWGRDLPPHHSFVLGGNEGFPGLQRYELRGDREAVVSVQSTYRVAGPLDLRLQVAAGRIASGGSLLGDLDWRAGARVGVGVETPIGPIHFETGWGSGGRKASLVRIGRWF